MCPVCIERRANTKEDIVPQWARERYADFGEWPGGLPSELMPMCSVCNGQFGQNFENAAAPLMGPMVDGEPVANGTQLLLTSAEQGVIGQWVIKTTLLSYLARGPRANAPADKLETCRQICCDMKVNKTPPRQSFVRIGWVNPHPYRDQGIANQAHHQPGPLPPAAYFSVSSLGFLVWEAVIGDPQHMNPLIDRTKDTRQLMRVWPPQSETLSWPPLPVNDADLHALRQAWSVSVWPPAADAPLDGVFMEARTLPPKGPHSPTP